MPPRVPPSRIAQALEYLQGLKSGVGEFVGGVGSNLADRARAAGGLAYEALTSDPNIGRMTTAEFSQAAADRAPTPRLDQAAQDIGTIGRAIVTQPVETGKAIVRGEVERAQQAMTSPQAAGQYAGSFIDPTRLAAALRHRIPISEIDAYHGTADDFEAFDPKMGGRATGAGSAREATWFVDKPKVAEGYAVHAAEDAPVLRKLQEADRLERIAQRSNRQQDWDKYDAAVRESEELDATKYDRRIADARLLEVDIPDETKFLEVDAGGKTPLQLSEESNIDSWLREQLRQARRQNKEGVKIVNLDDTAGGVNMPATHYAVFDPSGVKIKSKVRILERNGQPAPERIAQALEAAPQGGTVVGIRSRQTAKMADRINESLGGGPQSLSDNVQREMKLATSVLQSKNPQSVEDWIQAYYDADLPMEQFEAATTNLRKTLPPETVDALIQNAGAFGTADQLKAFLNATPAERAKQLAKVSK
jgi:hypothetical protein